MRRRRWTDSEVLEYGRAVLSPPVFGVRVRPATGALSADTRAAKLRRLLEHPSTSEPERVAARAALERLERGGVRR